MEIILTGLDGESYEIGDIAYIEKLERRLFKKFPTKLCSILYEDKFIIDKNKIIGEKIFRKLRSKLWREDSVTFTIIKSPILLVQFSIYTLRDDTDLMTRLSHDRSDISYYKYIEWFQIIFEKIRKKIRKDLFLLYNNKELNNVFRIELYFESIKNKKRYKIIKKLNYNSEILICIRFTYGTPKKVFEIYREVKINLEYTNLKDNLEYNMCEIFKDIYINL
jgi:hypothetical protein